MPALWQELWEVPGQDDLWEFARRVWALFQLPKVSCHTAKVENDYSATPAPHSLDRDCFLPIQDMWFGGQDLQLKQLQKTLAYIKALQHWVEKAQPLTPGKPCQLAESVLELQHEMDPLTMFTDEDVLKDLQSSNWVRITLSKSVEPAKKECSRSRICSTCVLEGHFQQLNGYKGKVLKALTTAQMVSKPTATAQEVELKQEGTVHQ